MCKQLDFSPDTTDIIGLNSFDDCDDIVVCICRLIRSLIDWSSVDHGVRHFSRFDVSAAGPRHSLLLRDGDHPLLSLGKLLCDGRVGVGIAHQCNHATHDTRDQGQEDVRSDERPEGEPVQERIAEVCSVWIFAVEVIVSSEYPDIP